jgi:1,4-alpha-glucan branching enzyme
MTTSIYNPRKMGAIPYDDGSTHFRVWAPHATSVAVVGEFNNWDPTAHPLPSQEGGMWAGTVEGAKAGQQYQFEITNGELTFRKNDAYAREIHPKSGLGVIYADSYQWHSADFKLANWNELVMYELHVGSFAPGPNGRLGNFDQIIGRLPYLQNLGINVLEIMPPMAFPGETSWGYNLTYPFAIEASYGGSDGFKRLVDAAHQRGIGVVLDVVINHFGPDKLDLWQYDGWSENNKGGIYFYNDHRSWTPWGENRPDFGRGEVRQYLRDSCLLWLDEFRCDGLRFDATLFIRNARGEQGNKETELGEGWSLMQWINDEARRFYPGVLTIAEDLQQNHWLTKTTGEGGAGFNSQWDSAFVHPLREALIATNDEDRSMKSLERAINFRYNFDFIQRIIYSDSHDQDANGQSRLAQAIDPHDAAGFYARKRTTLGAGLVMTAPGIPMLFEGQEFLEDGWFRDDKALDWSKLKTYQGINKLYRDLVYLRRNHYGNTKGLTGPYAHIFHSNDHGKVIAFHRWAEGGPKDDVVIVASFNHQTFENYQIGLPHGGKWLVRFSADWQGYSPDFQGIGELRDEILAEKNPYDGLNYSGRLSIAPYGFLVLSQEEAQKDSDDKAEEAPQQK